MDSVVRIIYTFILRHQHDEYYHCAGCDSDDEDIIRCVCNMPRDEGLMIQCERCLVWQHCDCMGVDTTARHNTSTGRCCGIQGSAGWCMLRSVVPEVNGTALP